MYEAWNYFAKFGKNVNLNYFHYPQWCRKTVSLLPLLPAALNFTNGRRLVKAILSDKKCPIGDTCEERLVPYTEMLPGYSSTKHGGKYDLVKSFVPFLITDCDPPGKNTYRK